MLGNWDCESNCESVRVQGDFNPYRTMSKQYVEDIATGRISRDSFKNDQKGFGLAQWTYFTRKAALYDYWKAKGGSIGDEALQVDFALLELRSDYSGLLNNLKTSNDLYQCVKDVCWKFENPAVKNVDARFQSANRIKAQIDVKPGPVPPQPEPPEPEPPKPDVYWPPRTIDCHCDGWPEVVLLGSILYCRGYLRYAAGSWDEEMTEAVTQFQRDNALDADGCVGPMTWTKLLERG
jgi:peptidoglycan hydrolase-like protein with peptidoglycan-binding domain